MCKHPIFLLILLIFAGNTYCQTGFTDISLSVYNRSDEVFKDSIEKKKRKYINARASMIKSVILPGLGQAANHQYWKIPILYAGFAVCTYSIVFANNYYQDFKQAYIWRTDGDSMTIDEYDPIYGSNPLKYSADQLKSARDYYRRNLELSVIITAGVYLLNVIDAYVSANLLNFDVSDDLGIQFYIPSVQTFQGKRMLMNGIALRF